MSNLFSGSTATGTMGSLAARTQRQAKTTPWTFHGTTEESKGETLTEDLRLKRDEGEWRCNRIAPNHIK